MQSFSRDVQLEAWQPAELAHSVSRRRRQRQVVPHDKEHDQKAAASEA